MWAIHECPDTESVGLWDKQFYQLNAISTIGIQFDAKPLLQQPFLIGQPKFTSIRVHQYDDLKTM